MNVVYIIGNGFDLQIGLPTSYQDFYRYYTSLESKSESVRKLKAAIKDTLNDWSDLEMALGQYTSQTESVQEFCDAYDDLQQCLRDYILKVDELMKSGEFILNVDSDTLERGFLFPESAFRSDEAYTIGGEYERVAPGLSQRQAIYNASVLTFNYTHVIEHYLKGTFESSFSNFSRYLNSVQHVHREVVKDQSIWVGVDNEEQVINEHFRNESNVRVRILKPWILSNISRRMLSEAKNLIQGADVLVIFGASLGPSDLTWAKLISERISAGAVVMLFVHNDLSYPSDNAKLNDQIKYREEFMMKMEHLGAEISEDSIIFVEINSTIFTNGLPNNHDDNLNIVLEKLLRSKTIAM